MTALFQFSVTFFNSEESHQRTPPRQHKLHITRRRLQAASLIPLCFLSPQKLRFCGDPILYSLCAPLRALPAQKHLTFRPTVVNCNVHSSVSPVGCRPRSSRPQASLCVPGVSFQREGPRPSLCVVSRVGGFLRREGKSKSPPALNGSLVTFCPHRK